MKLVIFLVFFVLLLAACATGSDCRLAFPYCKTVALQ